MEVIGADQDDGASPLLERLAEGDPSALEMLYDKFAPQLYGYALGMLGRPEAAEDGLQELFLNLARSRGKLGHVRSVRAYLFVMLRNAIWRRLRRNAAGEFSVDPAAIFQRPGPPGLPEGAAADIESALARLPAEQKEVILLKVYQDMTFPEIADVTGVSANTATSRYRYALDKLRALLPPDLLQER
jgi:RNA polymerase sigma-70 factor (ECF subfamily)